MKEILINFLPGEVCFGMYGNKIFKGKVQELQVKKLLKKKL